MVIVPLTPRGLDSSIPQGKSAAGPPLPPVTVHVVQHDPASPAQFLIDSHVVPSTELESTLRSMLAVRQDRTLFVAGERNLTYRDVAEVIGRARLAGAGRIALEAESRK